MRKVLLSANEWNLGADYAVLSVEMRGPAKLDCIAALTCARRRELRSMGRGSDNLLTAAACR